MAIAQPLWKTSLHGGHSGTYCDHGRDRLRDFIEAAIAYGYHTFGMTDHAPRVEERFLYDQERAMGWDIDRLMRNFDDYAAESRELVEEYDGRICLLRGFEAEVVPSDRYATLMQECRARHDFDYVVGSVHYVDEISVDNTQETFEEAVQSAGGEEALALRYYRLVGEMVENIRPEVVGHLDVVRRRAHNKQAMETDAVRAAARQALEKLGEHSAIMDINTAGYRKGLGGPYPAPWLIRMARDIGIGFCFGDDSHGADEVGAGLNEARRYLLDLGVREMTVLTRQDGRLVRRKAPLD